MPRDQTPWRGLCYNCPIFESTQEQPPSRPRALSVPYFEMAGITLGTSLWCLLDFD